MNTKCPQCETSYSVTEAHIGRKVKCKNCSAAMVVTEYGLELQGAAAPPAAPAVPAGGGAFEFDAGQADDRDEERESRRKPAKAKGRRRDEEEDDYDRDDDRPARSRERKPKAPSNLGAYLSFRKMIGPAILQILFWLIVGVILLGALGYAVLSLMSGSTMLILITLASLAIGVPLYLVFIRVSFELAMAIYRTHDAVNDIKQLLEKQGGSPGSAGPQP